MSLQIKMLGRLIRDKNQKSKETKDQSYIMSLAKKKKLLMIYLCMEERACLTQQQNNLTLIQKEITVSFIRFIYFLIQHG
jgi:hypothetical protein